MKKEDGKPTKKGSKRDIAAELAEEREKNKTLVAEIKEARREASRLRAPQSAAVASVPNEVVETSRTIVADARVTALRKEVAEANKARSEAELARDKAQQQVRDLLSGGEGLKRDFDQKVAQLHEASETVGGLKAELAKLRRELRQASDEIGRLKMVRHSRPAKEPANSSTSKR